MPNDPNMNVRENFRINYIIYFSLLGGMITFFVLAFIILTGKDQPVDENVLRILSLLVPTFAVIEIFLSRFMYSKFSKQISANATLNEKINKYKIAKITSWALLEGAALFSIVAFIITRGYLFSIVFLIIIGAFVLSKPSPDEFLNDFNVEGADRNEFL